MKDMTWYCLMRDQEYETSARKDTNAIQWVRKTVETCMGLDVEQERMWWKGHVSWRACMTMQKVLVKEVLIRSMAGQAPLWDPYDIFGWSYQSKLPHGICLGQFTFYEWLDPVEWIFCWIAGQRKIPRLNSKLKHTASWIQWIQGFWSPFAEQSSRETQLSR